MTKNRAASRLVLAEFDEEKVISAARQARAEIGPDRAVSCAVAFVSADYAPHLEDFLELVRVYGQAPLLVGCTGGGLIGAGVEAEEKSGFSLLLLSLPNTTLTPFEFTQGQVEESSGPGFWQMETGLGAEDVDAWIVLANPFRLDLDRWLGEWNTAYPGVPAIGGFASANSTGEGDGTDEIVLFRDGRVIPVDGLALGLRGGVRVQTVVSQGCRPIGEPLTVTGVKNGNFLLTLGSKPAYEVLNQVFQGLSEKEKARAQGNLFAGLAMSEYLDDYRRGDFLIRPIIGADRDAGVVAIGGQVRVGQTLQYQLRDRDSADEDLRELCHAARAENEALPGSRPFASLLFVCNGRGKGLFKTPNHDAGALAEIFGPLPGAGFFCNGEIGPVGKQNFVHGYTASIALLCEG